MLGLEVGGRGWGLDPDLRGGLLQQHQQGLQHQVREAWADGHVVQQPLYVVHHHAAQLGLVGVIKHLGGSGDTAGGGGQRETGSR